MLERVWGGGGGRELYILRLQRYLSCGFYGFGKAILKEVPKVRAEKRVSACWSYPLTSLIRCVAQATFCLP